MKKSLGRVSVKRCRKLVRRDWQYSDKELLNLRDRLYKLAEVVVDKFIELKTYVTRSITVDAKARIINN
ncbi:MAG: hypothetical protein GF390_00125 [Candidatus Pacebacteria bacterium]|nr:hypothetical protein [Candidatus Paceibacterota bacterium]